MENMEEKYFFLKNNKCGHRNVRKFEIKTQDWILSKNNNPGLFFY
jgi:hypothetical protein